MLLASPGRLWLQRRPYDVLRRNAEPDVLVRSTGGRPMNYGAPQGYVGPSQPGAVATPAPAPRRDRLATIAYVSVILATMGYAFETVRQQLAATAALASRGPQAGKLEESAYTNAQAAHVTLTNLNAFTVETCVRGVVTGKARSTRVESVPVCTGEMKPRSTVAIEAPYRVGAVEALCSSEPDRFGMTHLDWSRCSFDLEPVK